MYDQYEYLNWNEINQKKKWMFSSLSLFLFNVIDMQQVIVVVVVVVTPQINCSSIIIVIWR